MAKQSKTLTQYFALIDRNRLPAGMPPSVEKIINKIDRANHKAVAAIMHYEMSKIIETEDFLKNTDSQLTGIIRVPLRGIMAVSSCVSLVALLDRRADTVSLLRCSKVLIDNKELFISHHRKSLSCEKNIDDLFREINAVMSEMTKPPFSDSYKRLILYRNNETGHISENPQWEAMLFRPEDLTTVFFPTINLIELINSILHGAVNMFDRTIRRSKARARIFLMSIQPIITPPPGTVTVAGSYEADLLQLFKDAYE